MEQRGACGAPGVSGACGDHPEGRDALIRTGCERTECLARSAPPWQMRYKSHREEGLRHARSPDNRCGASLRHRGVLFSRDSLSHDGNHFTYPVRSVFEYRLYVQMSISAMSLAPENATLELGR